MAEHLYSVGVTKTTGAAAGAVVSIVPGALGAGIRMPEIREVRIFSVSGVAAEVGLCLPAAIGTGAITGSTVQPFNQIDAAGHTQVATSFATTQPTAPTNPPYDREELQAGVGAGMIFTYGPGEWPLWSGATIPHVVLWQFSLLAVTYDVTVKVAE